MAIDRKTGKEIAAIITLLLGAMQSIVTTVSVFQADILVTMLCTAPGNKVIMAAISVSVVMSIAIKALHLTAAAAAANIRIIPRCRIDVVVTLCGVVKQRLLVRFNGAVRRGAAPYRLALYCWRFPRNTRESKNNIPPDEDE